MFCFTLPLAAQRTGKPVIIPIKDNMNNERVINLSEIASDICYVPLETKDECLIGDDYMLQYVDGQLFVMSGVLYRFDGKTGKFLNKIGAVGQGPGEYYQAVHYTVNPETKRVYVLMFKTMQEYDYDGKFIRTLPADNHNVGACCMLNDTQLIYANDAYNYTTEESSDQLYTVDLIKGKVVGRIKSPVDKRLRGALNLSSFDFFYTYNNQVYFKGSFQDEIYHIQSPKAKSQVYIFDRGYLKADYSKKNAEIDPRNRMRGIQIQNIFETEPYVLISYMYENKVYQGVFNKKDHSFSNAVTKDKKVGLTNDLTGGNPVFIAQFQVSPQNMIVSSLRADYLVEHKKELTMGNPLLPARKTEWEKILNSINEESNPIVVLVTVK